MINMHILHTETTYVFVKTLQFWPVNSIGSNFESNEVCIMNSALCHHDRLLPELWEGFAADGFDKIVPFNLSSTQQLVLGCEKKKFSYFRYWALLSALGQ